MANTIPLGPLFQPDLNMINLKLLGPVRSCVPSQRSAEKKNEWERNGERRAGTRGQTRKQGRRKAVRKKKGDGEEEEGTESHRERKSFKPRRHAGRGSCFRREIFCGRVEGRGLSVMNCSCRWPGGERGRVRRAGRAETGTRELQGRGFSRDVRLNEEGNEKEKKKQKR